ncbi:MAG: succinate dehydrogenase/fumarate reductase iron-sulfur subunit [Gemmatimonadetes bacterium]|nr:succinate dehydrogenase/fumarate reductase iron-sulfur subunit [Gemmatimonadota bacterium]
MRVTAHVFRFDPAANTGAWLESYPVDAFPDMTVLDLLFEVVRRHDPALSFRCSCRVGMCGTCTLLINGREGLACQTKVAMLGDEITVRPLNHLPVVKDLVVDMDPFFVRLRAVDASFHGDPARQEIARVVWEREDLLGEAGDCITCGACLSACSMLALDRGFVGPAALYRALMLVEDPREGEPEPRVARTLGEHGVWRCHGHMDCVKVCPKQLPLTKAIHSLKRLGVRWAVGARLPRQPPAGAAGAEARTAAGGGRRTASAGGERRGR